MAALELFGEIATFDDSGNLQSKQTKKFATQDLSNREIGIFGKLMPDIAWAESKNAQGEPGRVSYDQSRRS